MIRDDGRSGVVTIVAERVLNPRPGAERDRALLERLLAADVGIVALPRADGAATEAITIARDAVDYLGHGYRVILLAEVDDPWWAEVVAQVRAWGGELLRTDPEDVGDLAASEAFLQRSAPGEAGRESAVSLRLDPSATQRSGSDREDAPVVLVLHGYGGDETWFAPWLAEIPDRYAVLAPRGPVASLEGQWAWFPAGPPGEPERTDADAALAALMHWLDIELPGRTIVPYGFSQGAAMALMLLRARPGTVPAAVSVAGFTVPGDRTGDDVLSVLRPPVLAVWDPDDPVVLPGALARTSEWLQRHTRLSRHPQQGGVHDVDGAVAAAAARFLDGLPLR